MTFEDVTQHSRLEAEKDVLLVETRHRMRNLLAVVRALVGQTRVAGRTAEEYREVFLSLKALVRAQGASLSGAATTTSRTSSARRWGRFPPAWRASSRARLCGWPRRRFCRST